MTRRAVFLDRDGVLNATVVADPVPLPPRSVEELEILPGVPAACEQLRAAGFLLLVVTNQPDIARGALEPAAAEAINGRIREQLPLDDVLVCPHDDADGCDCRKPLPGLLLHGARVWGVDLAASYMVGDRWRDIEAGRRAGCTTVLVDRGYRERPAEGFDVAVHDLVEAAGWILAREPGSTRETRIA